jgi:hypothetical protein
MAPQIMTSSFWKNNESLLAWQRSFRFLLNGDQSQVCRVRLARRL